MDRKLIFFYLQGIWRRKWVAAGTVQFLSIGQAASIIVGNGDAQRKLAALRSRLAAADPDVVPLLPISRNRPIFHSTGLAASVFALLMIYGALLLANYTAIHRVI